MRLSTTFLALLILWTPRTGAGAGPGPQFDPAEYQLRETSVRPDGGHVAWVLRQGEKETLYVDGEEVARAAAIEQVHLSASGETVFWRSNGKEEAVVYRGEPGPSFDAITVPDLDVLAGLAVPHDHEWGYLGGTRVAFAARNQGGEWIALLRFVAAWQNQENRPLPTSRTVYESPDPASKTHHPLRYRLLKDKIPVYIGIRDNRECLVIGRTNYGCGRQVAMLAIAPDKSQVAFALRQADGLEVYSRFGVTGPTANVDWVAFSPDGGHLAYVVKDGRQHALYVDGKLDSRHEVVAALAWLPDGRLATLVHEHGGSRVLVDGQPLLEKPFIERLLLAPDGRALAVGKDNKGPFLDPYGRPAEFTSIWGEGFLTTGAFFSFIRRLDGKVSVILDDHVSPPFAGIKRLFPSPDGAHLVGVGASIDGDTVMVDGKEWQTLPGRAERFTWCGGQKLQVLERGLNLECLVSDGRERLCCPRIVATGCDAEGAPSFVCLEQSKFHLHRPDGTTVGPFDDVPQHLLYQDAETGHLSFAARSKDEWKLYLSGSENTVRGKILQVLPAGDRAWYLEQADIGMRWVTRIGATEWFDSVSAPVEYAGMPLFRARLNGKECWVDDARKYACHDAIVSSLYPAAEGGFYWALDGDRVQLQALEF